MSVRVNSRKVLGFFLTIGIAFLPVYLWSSGGVQVSHAVLFIVAAGILFSRGLKLDAAGTIFGMLVVYVALRESFFAIRNTSLESLLPVLHVCFTWFIFVTLRAWFSDQRNWGQARIGLIVAVVMAVISVVLFGYGATIDSEGGRSVGTFNNPNQLGYFSVCVVSLAGLLYLRSAASLPLMILLLGGGLFLAIASLSKAAMVSCAFATLFVGFLMNKSTLQLFIGVLASAALVLVTVWLINSGYLSEYKFVVRLAGIGAQADDSLAGRGYGVLVDVGPLEFLFGYGAQEVREIVGHELHSTIGSFFANYGVIGGLLFMSVMTLWLLRVWTSFGTVGVMVMFVPPMLYGLAHNGSRFTIFWLLVAMSYALTAKRTERRGGSSIGYPVIGFVLSAQNSGWVNPVWRK